MLSDFLVFIISFAILVYSSELFVLNSARIAGSLGVSHFIIGMTVIGIGTSLPEIVVTVYASITGNYDIALGNVIGSNITNIALILGITFFYKNMSLQGSTLKKDSIGHLSVLIAGTLIVVSGNYVSQYEGLLLVAIFAVYMLYSVKSHDRLNSDDPGKTVNARSVIYTVAGLCGVLGGSKYMVDSAVVIADKLSIPSSAIALTVIALGTSVPELSVSVSAARRGYFMFILGNIIGSNITNMMLGIGIASIIHEIRVENAAVIRFNLMYMLLLSVILIASVWKENISRRWAVMFLSLYVLFIGMTYLAGL